MHLLTDDGIPSTTHQELNQAFSSIKAMVKSASIPDVKSIREVSERLDDRIRVWGRASKDLNNLLYVPVMSKAMANSVLGKYTLPTVQLTMDKSVTNKVTVNKQLLNVVEAQTNEINELWSTIVSLLEDLVGTDQVEDVNSHFRKVISDCKAGNILLEYVNTDTTLATKVDSALAKIKEGKTNSLARLIQGNGVKTALDTINLIADYQLVARLKNAHSRVIEIQENVTSTHDMERNIATLLEYARLYSDYLKVTKWCCAAVMDNVLINAGE